MAFIYIWCKKHHCAPSNGLKLHLCIDVHFHSLFYFRIIGLPRDKKIQTRIFSKSYVSGAFLLAIKRTQNSETATMSNGVFVCLRMLL